MSLYEKTLTEFIIGEQRKAQGATGGFTALLNDICLACKRIAYLVGKGALTDAVGHAGSHDAQGEAQMKLDVMANDIFLRTNEWGGHLAAMVSENMEQPYLIPAQYPRGRYLLVFDPLDGSSNIDVNVSVGSIFSVLRCVDGVVEPTARLIAGAKSISTPHAPPRWLPRVLKKQHGADSAKRSQICRFLR